jgi:hypothetical protein
MSSFIKLYELNKDYRKTNKQFKIITEAVDTICEAFEVMAFDIYSLQERFELNSPFINDEKERDNLQVINIIEQQMNIIINAIANYKLVKLRKNTGLNPSVQRVINLVSKRLPFINEALKDILYSKQDHPFIVLLRKYYDQFISLIKELYAMAEIDGYEIPELQIL